MKNLSLVFAILLVVLWVTNTEGCRRRRKPPPPPPSPSCGFNCWTSCVTVRCVLPGVCKPYCRRQCGYRCRGKREIRNKNMVSLKLYFLLNTIILVSNLLYVFKKYWIPSMLTVFCYRDFSLSQSCMSLTLRLTPILQIELLYFDF